MLYYSWLLRFARWLACLVGLFGAWLLVLCGWFWLVVAVCGCCGGLIGGFGCCGICWLLLVAIGFGLLFGMVILIVLFRVHVFVCLPRLLCFAVLDCFRWVLLV